MLRKIATLVSWPQYMGLFLSAFMVALTFWMLAPAAFSDGPGVIQGQVVNGMAKTPLGSVPATLYIYKNQAQQEARPGTADAQGNFQFAGLETGPEFGYEVTTDYKGITYTTGLLTFSPEEKSKTVPLQVFDATADNGAISLEQSILILDRVDNQMGAITATEIAVISNSGDKTFSGNPQQPMTLLRFSLPAGAVALQPLAGLEPEQVIQVDRGFAATTPIAPGIHQMVFSYGFPYTSPTTALDRGFPTLTHDFSLLIPEDVSVGVDSSQLKALGTVDLDNGRFEVFSARELAAGTRLPINLTGLPAITPPTWALGETPAKVASIAGGSIILLIPILYVLLRRGAKKAEQDQARHEELLYSLAELDEDYERGDIEQEEYQRERAHMKGALLSLMLSEGQRTPTLSEEAKGG